MDPGMDERQLPSVQFAWTAVQFPDGSVGG